MESQTKMQISFHSFFSSCTEGIINQQFLAFEVNNLHVP